MELNLVGIIMKLSYISDSKKRSSVLSKDVLQAIIDDLNSDNTPKFKELGKNITLMLEKLLKFPKKMEQNQISKEDKSYRSVKI